jgi:hypothetical protein
VGSCPKCLFEAARIETLGSSGVEYIV